MASSEFPFTVIDHKFMLSGHSYLPNDCDFGGIEAARRRRSTIFIPEDWYTLVENARRTNRFHVKRMEQAHFLSMEPLTKLITNRKVTITGQKVECLTELRRTQHILSSIVAPTMTLRSGKKLTFSQNTLDDQKTWGEFYFLHFMQALDQ